MISRDRLDLLADTDPWTLRNEALHLLHKLEQAEATIERVRALRRAWDIDRLRMRAAVELDTALNGTPPSLGARVRTLRLAKGWTLSDLANAAGMAWNSIGNIEASKQTPGKDSLTAIAAALGVPVSDLGQPAKEGR